MSYCDSPNDNTDCNSVCASWNSPNDNTDCNSVYASWNSPNDNAACDSVCVSCGNSNDNVACDSVCVSCERQHLQEQITADKELTQKWLTRVSEERTTENTKPRERIIGVVPAQNNFIGQILSQIIKNTSDLLQKIDNQNSEMEKMRKTNQQDMQLIVNNFAKLNEIIDYQENINKEVDSFFI